MSEYLTSCVCVSYFLPVSDYLTPCVCVSYFFPVSEYLTSCVCVSYFFPVSLYLTQFCNDMWLMFDNAWLYNKKTSKVYKMCTKLYEVFSEHVDNTMKSFGYCCGSKVSWMHTTQSCQWVCISTEILCLPLHTLFRWIWLLISACTYIRANVPTYALT